MANIPSRIASKQTDAREVLRIRLGVYCPLAASGDKDTDTHSSAITELLKFAIAATIPMHRDVSLTRAVVRRKAVEH